ncbi:MAG: SGNH/GDSL hydrolase family protein [Clostridia bacterium]|nr:SGNH/GDSL hydrolase family protein [Clostridia bacterium]
MQVYAFGDSIVYGHTAPQKSFMQLIADEYGIALTMCARNGATVIPQSGNDIITQVKNAPASEPDIVIFNGYTNDAYDVVLQKLGSPKGCTASVFDNGTFSGAFEEIIYTMRQKWHNAKILYVTVHKNGARDWTVQKTLHNLAVSICRNWSVDVADIFTLTPLDTRDNLQMKKYIMGENGSHPNEEACRRFYIPNIIGKLL